MGGGVGNANSQNKCISIQLFNNINNHNHNIHLVICLFLLYELESLFFIQKYYEYIYIVYREIQQLHHVLRTACVLNYCM